MMAFAKKNQTFIMVIVSVKEVDKLPLRLKQYLRE